MPAVFNRNAGFEVTYPKSVMYAPDPSLGRAVQNHEWTDVSAQLTWQAAPKHKLSFGIQRRTAFEFNTFVGSIFGGAVAHWPDSFTLVVSTVIRRVPGFPVDIWEQLYGPA